MISSLVKFSSRFLFVFSFAMLMLLALEFSWFGLPAFGPLLSPFRGYWNSSTPQTKGSLRYLSLKGVKEPTQILWDQFGVPHIRATNTEDLYLAQGYVTARDRLFQMDFQARAAEARLSEALGERTEKLDDRFIQFGMRELIRRVTEEFRKDPATWKHIEAYSRGVNLYLSDLPSWQWPLEYKIIGASPLPWSPARTAALFALMTFRLAGLSHDLELTEYMKKYGKDIERLFSYEQLGQTPFAPLLKLKEFNLPEVPDDKFVTSFSEFPELLKPAPWNGSNNWAVSGARSESGYSLLANDTHLAYHLPNVWYEIQLQTKEMDVYGASLPGAPGVIVGFNRNIGWGVTNATPDVLDYFEVRLRRRNSQWQYFFDNNWRTVQIQDEKYNVRSGQVPFLQEQRLRRVLWTHHGPIVMLQGDSEEEEVKGLALKWAPMAGSNPFLTFSLLNRAQTKDQCEEALKTYYFPAQNFICAGLTNVSIVHAGKIPRRWWGQGRYVLDGSNPRHNWAGYLTYQDLPRSSRDIVFSANQHPVDSAYPYYLNWDYSEPFRAARIKEQLEKVPKHNVLSFKNLQNDFFNGLAAKVLPRLIADLNKNLFTDPQKNLISSLKEWDFEDRADDSRAGFFFFWWKNFENLVWQDDFGEGTRSFWPRATDLVRLIEESNFKWFDKRDTKDKTETYSDVLLESFNLTWKELTKRAGEDFTQWTLGRLRPLEINHIARLPGFGARQVLPMGGTARTVNANTGRHGATWRMIVELGPQVQGWINYPGGPSGDPFSQDYDSFTGDWRKGEMRRAEFLRGIDFDEAPGQLEKGKSSFRQVWRIVGE